MKRNFSLNRYHARVARLNKLVIMVAFLWFVASIMLLLFASGSAHATQTPSRHEHQKPTQQMTAIHTPEAAYS